MRSIIVIPARAKSSRFPNKPLININGKPMIYWVYKNAVNTTSDKQVYVATESKEIYKACKELNIKCLITSDEHETGTDRVAEVSEIIDADNYIVLMGDEPLIESKHIQKLVNIVEQDSTYDAAMLCTEFNNPVDVVNPSTIKLAINSNNELIYISRGLIPYPKASLDYAFYKNLGCYSFTKKALDDFKNTPVGSIERIEEIEMLRLIELRKKVACIKVKSESFSIDTKADYERLIKKIDDRPESFTLTQEIAKDYTPPPNLIANNYEGFGLTAGGLLCAA